MSQTDTVFLPAASRPAVISGPSGPLNDGATTPNWAIRPKSISTVIGSDGNLTWNGGNASAQP